MQVMLNIILVVVPILLVGMFIACWCLVPRLEQVLLFRPVKEVISTPSDVGIAFDQCRIETPDGCQLIGWRMCPSLPVGNIIYFHGNGGNLGILVEIFQALYSNNLQVLAFDYRGYGSSTGTPSEAGLYQDGLAAVRYFQDHIEGGDLPIVYWGRSLGSCVAAYVASQISPDGLILETAFSSKKSLVRYHPTFRWFHPFSHCKLNTIKYLEDYSSPSLLLHGDQDQTVPLEEGKSLFRNLNGPKKFYCVSGADHINLHRIGGDSYMRTVVQFIDSLASDRS